MGRLSDFRNMDIDWNMAPEDAVTLYLEWGNNSWHADFQPVRSKNDFSTYFVVNTWGGRPVVYLIRRNSEEARELACVDLPDDLGSTFMRSIGNLKGIHQPTPEIRNWLEKEING